MIVEDTEAGLRVMMIALVCAMLLTLVVAVTTVATLAVLRDIAMRTVTANVSLFDHIPVAETTAIVTRILLDPAKVALTILTRDIPGTAGRMNARETVTVTVLLLPVLKGMTVEDTMTDASLENMIDIATTTIARLGRPEHPMMTVLHRMTEHIPTIIRLHPLLPTPTAPLVTMTETETTTDRLIARAAAITSVAHIPQEHLTRHERSTVPHPVIHTLLEDLPFLPDLAVVDIRNMRLLRLVDLHRLVRMEVIIAEAVVTNLCALRSSFAFF